MFDEKIAMILLPVWLASVLGTLYLGFTRPVLYRIVCTLLDKGCHSPDTALEAKALGIGKVWERLLLRPGSSLRRLVLSADETPKSSLRVQVEQAGKKHYYLPPEHQDKAKVLYGKKPANIWQSMALCLLLTAVFFGLWMAASLVFDTSGWKPLFR